MISWLRRRFPLVLIMLIGILTPVAATLLFYLSPPSNNTARGEILLPQPLPADWNLNTGKWTLLYASTGTCLPPCQKRLCQMRQLRLMLPGSYLRLQRVWLRPPQSSPPPNLTAAADCGETRAAAFADSARQINITDGLLHIDGDINRLPPPSDNTRRTDYLYLIDPAGIAAMRFSPQLDIYTVRKDVAKLLKISKGRKTIGARP